MVNQTQARELLENFREVLTGDNQKIMKRVVERHLGRVDSGALIHAEDLDDFMCAAETATGEQWPRINDEWLNNLPLGRLK